MGSAHRAAEESAARSFNALEDLGISAAASSILRYFLVRPEARPHAREIQRVLKLGGASLQRELARLVAAGALERSPQGRRTHYSTSDDVRLWTALRLLAATATDPLPLIENAIADVPGVAAAFVFGSVARGRWDREADVDLLVVENADINRRRLFSHMAEIELLLGRDINVLRYSVQELAERLGDSEHPASRFLRAVLAGPKRWVAGEPEVVINLAVAAGLPSHLASGQAG
jgi:predicted nucleotidyltransferase